MQVNKGSVFYLKSIYPFINPVTMKKQSIILALLLFIVSFNIMAASGPSDSLLTGPVRLLSFKGAVSNDIDKLHWITEDEHSLQSFTIERSDNGRDFYPIAIMPAMNEKGQLYYEYTDNTISKTAAGFSYRLKITDADNKDNYSPVVILYADNKKNAVCYTAKRVNK